VNDLNRSAQALWNAGDVRAAVDAWLELAALWRRSGRLDQAVAVLRTVVHLTDGGDSNLQRVALYALAEAQAESGELLDATRWIRRALELGEELGDPAIIADDLEVLAELFEERGEFAEAYRLRRRALGLLSSDEYANARHDALVAVARTCAALEQRAQAQDYEARAEALAEEMAA
jgi:tetratricopeptide (TPR) repeat protein